MSKYKQKQPVIQTAINTVLAGGGGGTGGTTDYTELENKPKINSVTLSGNKTTADLGIDEVTEVTSEDNGKVLTATYSEGSGSYEWDTVDEVPEVTSNDKGKVLTAGNVGQYQWKYLLPSITNSDDDKLVCVSGNGYSYVSNYRLLPPTITSSDAGKVLMAYYNGVSGSTYSEWAVPPLPKYITTIDSTIINYTLGTSVDNLSGFFKFIIYALNSSGLAMTGEFYEGYYYKEHMGQIETFEPYSSMYLPSTFSTSPAPSGMDVTFMGTDETVQIIEIPINTFT